MLVILIAVITQGPRIPSELRGATKGSLVIESGLFQAIGVISFGQYNAIQGIAGFLTFGDKTKGNVLNNFPPDNIVVNIARL
ncbi:MAG: hypothetical protein Q9216_004077 [Gyalolechia sp. 2 TL-2023]